MKGLIKWVICKPLLYVAIALAIIAAAAGRPAAVDAYNTGTDVGGWSIGTALSGIPNFFQSGFEGFKANTSFEDDAPAKTN